MKLNVVLIDDDIFSIRLFKRKLKVLSEDVVVLKEFLNPVDALAFVRKTEVDALFLDVNMPKYSGFEFMRRSNSSAQVVVVTGQSSKELEALRLGVFDFLYKPITKFELERVLGRLFEAKTKRLSDLEPSRKRQIKVKAIKGVIQLPIEQIMRCQAASNYTEVYLVNGERFLVLMSMKKMSELLSGVERFVRVSRSHLVNLEKVRVFPRSRHKMIMEDGTEVAVSRRLSLRKVLFFNS